MHSLDEKDQQILRVLHQNARMPFSQIAEEVDLSGPAVADRVKRLQQTGIITGFTIDIDRTQIRSGVPVFVQITSHSHDANQLLSEINDSERVEHVFVTANGSIWFSAHADPANIRDSLLDVVEAPDIDYEVTLLDQITWTRTLDTMEFDLTCAECGNTVDDQGTAWRIDETEYRFCCTSCESQFKERYTNYQEAT
jgi:DNA-binding Lrp family transcriptional regulator